MCVYALKALALEAQDSKGDLGAMSSEEQQQHSNSGHPTEAEVGVQPVQWQSAVAAGLVSTSFFAACR